MYFNIVIITLIYKTKVINETFYRIMSLIARFLGSVQS